MVGIIVTEIEITGRPGFSPRQKNRWVGLGLLLEEKLDTE